MKNPLIIGIVFVLFLILVGASDNLNAQTLNAPPTLVPFMEMSEEQKAVQANGLMNAKPPNFIVDSAVLRFVSKEGEPLICAIDVETDYGNCWRLSTVAWQYQQVEIIQKWIEDTGFVASEVVEPDTEPDSI